jgi:hypothetical protein
MRDYPDKNILLDDVEFNQDDINQGIEMVVFAYNAVTPQTTFSPQSFPSHLQYVLLLGVSWYLIKSCSFLQLRNQATYQDGDIAPIGIDDKFPLYMQLWQTLKAEWDQYVRAIKTQDNLEAVYGYVSSGYRNVSRFHHS